MSAPLLPEVPESQASGTTAAIYAQIRRLSAVPLVALIYRHMATLPGGLEWAWSELQPFMERGLLQERAWALADQVSMPHLPALPEAALRVAGVSASSQPVVLNILDAYNRTNPINLMGVTLLARRLVGRPAVMQPASAPMVWTPPAMLAEMPAMIHPAAMEPDTLAVTRLLTDRGHLGQPSSLVPSLYRHLAHWPGFLGYAATVLGPVWGEVDRAIESLQQLAQARVDELECLQLSDAAAPASVPDVPPELRAALIQFGQRIPEMIVIGSVLRKALTSGARII
jgi:hypothetical protein